jgi:hypothetical protein
LSSGCIFPRLLNPSTRWRQMVTFVPRPLYPRGNSPRCPLDRKLGGPQSLPGCCGSWFIRTSLIQVSFIAINSETEVLTTSPEDVNDIIVPDIDQSHPEMETLDLALPPCRTVFADVR